MEETSIYIHEVLILEPVTSLTDLLVSAVCFFAFFSLIRNKDSALHFKLIQWFFLTMGLATLSGGLIGHAFLYAFSFGWKLPGWLLSMLSISLLERASIEYAKPLLPKKLRRFMDWANIVELIIFMSLTFSFLNFRFVEIHSAFGLLAVNTPLYIYIYIKTKNKTSKLMLVAISFAIVSAIIFMNDVSIHKWFNHMDLSHVLMAGGAYFFYRGAIHFQEGLYVK